MKITVNKDDLYAKSLSARVHYSSLAMVMEQSMNWFDHLIGSFSRKQLFVDICMGRHDDVKFLGDMCQHSVDDVMLDEWECDLVYNLQSKGEIWKRMFG